MISEKIRFELSCACATYVNEIAKIHKKYGGNAEELYMAGVHALTEAHAMVEFAGVLGTYANGIARVAEKYGQNKKDMYLWGLGVLLQTYKDVATLKPVSNKEAEEATNDFLNKMIEAGGCCAEE